MVKFVYLDIEGTLIEDFSNPIILEKNRKIVRELVSNATHVFGFSWAVCNNKDYITGKNIIKSIDDEFSLGICEFVYRDDLFDMFKKIFGSGLDFNEFEDFCRCLGKEYVFQQYVRNILIPIICEDSWDMEIILFDDTVEDTVLEMKSKNGFDIKITTVKAK